MNRHLRREAGIWPWQQLTEDQREAAHSVAQRLMNILAEEYQPRPENPGVMGFLPAIDEIRTNHVILLDGKRGSGKSTVLVTLLGQWARLIRGEQPDEAEQFCPWGRSAPYAVLPIGLVDLQPLDPKTNLLLHVVGQMQRLVESMEQQGLPPGGPGEQRDRGGWGRDDWDLPTELRSRLAWRKFIKTVAAGWNGYEAGQRRDIDLDAYAIELEHAERQRMNIPDAFYRFVDALWEDVRAWRTIRAGAQPLFVLAIDDADMNPHKSAELLDLLRMLWHPRLAFVITGDRELFAQIIKIELVREFGLKNLSEPQLAYVFNELAPQLPDELAPQLLDKLVPSGQSFKLGNVAENERRRVLQARIAAHGDAALEATKPLLECLGIPAGEKDIEDLRAVEGAEWLQETVGAIPSNLRHISSLAQELVGSPDPADQLAVIVRDLKAELRIGHPNLRLGVYKEQIGTQQRLRTDLGLQVTNWRAEAMSTFQVASTKSLATAATVTARSEMQVFVLQPNQLRRSRALEVNLPPRYLGTVLFAMEMQRRFPDRILIEGEIAFLDRIFWVTVTIPDESGAEWELEWPLPRWTDIRAYFRAVRRWEMADPHSALEPKRGIDWLAAQYLAAVLAGAGVNVEPLGTGGSVRWAALAESVAELAAEGYENIGGRWALEAAPLLAAPESGLPTEIANEWIRALDNELSKRNLGGAWQARASYCRRERCIDDAEPVNKQVQKIEEFLENIDNESSAFEILNLFSVAHGQGVIPALMDAIKKVRVEYPISIANISSRSLDVLLPGHRLQKLSTASHALQRELYDGLTSLMRHQVQGVAPSAIYLIFKTVYDWHKEAGVPVSLVSLEDGRLYVNATVHMLEPEGDLGSAVKESWQARLEDGNMVSTRVLAEPAFAELPPGCPEIVDVALRMAFDVAVDEGDEEEIATNDGLQAPRRQNEVGAVLGGRWSPFAIEITGYSGAMLHLPVPSWPALIDWELLVDAWNREIQKIRSLYDEGHLSIDRMMNGLLWWYVDCVVAISKSRDATELRGVNRSSVNWPSLASTFIQHIADKQSQLETKMGKRRAHANAVYDWLLVIPAIAAPEFHLSEEAALVFLHSFLGYHIHLNNDTPQNPSNRRILHQARRACLRVSGVPDDDIEETIALIDKSHPEHPWVRMVEQAQ